MVAYGVEQRDLFGVKSYWEELRNENAQHGAVNCLQ